MAYEYVLWLWIYVGRHRLASPAVTQDTMEHIRTRPSYSLQGTLPIISYTRCHSLYPYTPPRLSASAALLRGI